MKILLRHCFRRLTDVRHVVARLPAPQAKIHPLARFLGEWAQSQARTETISATTGSSPCASKAELLKKWLDEPYSA